MTYAMKLCIITNILAPYRIRLFEEIGRRVESLDVILMASAHANRRWEIPEYSFRTHVSRGLHIRPPGHEEPYHLNLDVLALVNRINPDVIMSGGFALAHIQGFLFCRLRARRHVCWGELTLTDGADRSVIRRIIRRAMISKSAGNIASSTVARDSFVHYGASPQSVMVSLMPIDVGFFRQTAAAFRQTREFQELRDRFAPPRLISVGRLVDGKGYEELFEAYSRLVLRYATVSLIIVGDGPNRARYEELVRSRGWTRVHFVGFQQALEVAHYLSVADVFVFPTRSDTFGAVLSEAMSVGSIVVSSVHAAATLDLVSDNVSGFRVEPRDVDSTVSAISKAIELDSARRDEIKDAAYAAVERTDYSFAAQEMAAFLSGLL